MLVSERAFHESPGFQNIRCGQRKLLPLQFPFHLSSFFAQLRALLDNFDLERLHQFVSPGMEEQLVNDLWLPLAIFVFRGFCGQKAATEDAVRVDELQLSPHQKVALMTVGLQGKTLSNAARAYQVQIEQIRIQFRLAIKRIRDYLIRLKSASIAKKVELEIADTQKNIIQGLEQKALMDEHLTERAVTAGRVLKSSRKHDATRSRGSAGRSRASASRSRGGRRK